MAGDDASYEIKSVQTVRGMEARTMAKWEKEGWEFVTQSQEPLLRTKLTFRRLKPKRPRYLLPAAAGALLLIGIIVAVGVAQEGDDTPEANTPPTNAAVVQSEQPSNKPSEKPSQTTEPSAPATPTPLASTAEQTLTVQNNAELAALLTATDLDYDRIEGFATKYKGRTIEFDGNIADMNNHGDYKTRYDILIGAGNYSATSMPGPNFQFKDVNIVSDLHLTGSNIPDGLGKGNNLHIIARVEGFNRTQGLFFLKPVSTSVR
ncbi:DUF4839 domain-containing protein [Pseudarthrobacter sp. TAF60_1]|uniref:DUF4839 domain-containing protein n=1 Tax=Pseudarthrobacter sp. TAF60_1 TaxID=3233071 RepID=UPI003F982311